MIVGHSCPSCPGLVCQLVAAGSDLSSHLTVIYALSVCMKVTNQQVHTLAINCHLLFSPGLTFSALSVGLCSSPNLSVAQQPPTVSTTFSRRVAPPATNTDLSITTFPQHTCDAFSLSKMSAPRSPSIGDKRKLPIADSEHPYRPTDFPLRYSPPTGHRQVQALAQRQIMPFPPGTTRDECPKGQPRPLSRPKVDIPNGNRLSLNGSAPPTVASEPRNFHPTA